MKPLDFHKPQRREERSAAKPQISSAGIPAWCIAGFQPVGVRLYGPQALPTRMSAIQHSAAKPQPKGNRRIRGIHGKMHFALAQEIVAK